MQIKLPKRPDTIFHNEYLFNYILDLESKQKLEVLPPNLMVYYVLSTFANEVENGGVIQYFTNTSKLTYYLLRQCGALLAHFAFSPFIVKLCDYFDATDPSILESDIDQNMMDQSEVLDHEFYELDKKYDFFRVINAFYKANYNVEKIDVPKIKERESETCRYFTVPPTEICITTEEAIESFLKVLSDFSEQRWTVELWNFFDTYRIIATTYGKAIDLEVLIHSWDNCAFSFSKTQNGAYFDRMRISSCFEVVNVMSGTDGISQYAVKISSSGFSKYEKKMKHKFIMSGSAYDQEISVISVGDFSHKKNPEQYYMIKNYLEDHYREFRNIETVFESGEFK